MHYLNILSKVQINQVQDVSQEIVLYRPNSHTKAMDGLFKYIGNCAQIACAWGHLKHFILEHVHKRKVKTQPLFLQMSLLKVVFCICMVNSEHLNGSFMLFEKRFIHCLRIFLVLPLSVTPIYLSIKDLEIFD